VALGLAAARTAANATDAAASLLGAVAAAALLAALYRWGVRWASQRPAGVAAP
jgi:hypothetical protein